MIQIKALKLIALGFIFSILSGCSIYKPEPIIKTVYIKQDKYPFDKINTQGIYIDVKDKNTQKLCTPYILETSEIYKGIIEFYDWQIDEYNKGL